MSMRRSRLVGVLTALLVAGCDACPRPATIPLSFRHDLPVIPAIIDGHSVMMLLDTGANTSYVSESLAGGLVAAPPTQTMTVAGIAPGRRVNLARLTLGGTWIGPLTVGVDDLPGTDHTDGAIGLDILSRFDVELRPRQGTVVLWQGTCPGSPEQTPPYAVDGWPSDAPLSPARLNGQGQFIVPLIIDGHTLDAMVDTGATNSLLRARVAADLGVTSATLTHDPAVTVRTFADAALTLRRHGFASVRLGGKAVAADRFSIGDIALPTDALLGMDMLLADRLLLGFAHGVFGRAGG